MFGDGHVQACVKVTFFFPHSKLVKALTLQLGWRHVCFAIILLSRSRCLEEERKKALGTPEHRVSRTTGSGVFVSTPCLSSGPSPTWTSSKHLQHSRSAVETDTLSPTQGYLQSAPRR